MLLEGGVSADTSMDDSPVLLSAVAHTQSSIVQSLLKHRADPNATNSCGETALHIAASSADAESAAIIEDLLAAGADSQCRTGAAMPPLMLALDCNHKHAIEALLRGTT